MSPQFTIHKDIAKAETLPSSFYKDEDVFSKVREKIFLKSWQWLGDNSGLKLTNSVQPLTLLDGFLTEPILLMPMSMIIIIYFFSKNSLVLQILNKLCWLNSFNFDL